MQSVRSTGPWGGGAERRCTAGGGGFGLGEHSLGSVSSGLCPWVAYAYQIISDTLRGDQRVKGMLHDGPQYIRGEFVPEARWTRGNKAEGAGLQGKHVSHWSQDQSCCLWARTT